VLPQAESIHTHTHSGAKTMLVEKGMMTPSPKGGSLVAPTNHQGAHGGSSSLTRCRSQPYTKAYPSPPRCWARKRFVPWSLYKQPSQPASSLLCCPRSHPWPAMPSLRP